MKKINIGYRRLYDSMGCSLSTQEPLHLTFPFGNTVQIEIYLGNKPKLGIWTETDHEDYLIPGQQIKIGTYTYHADATESPYPRNFFTEIVCSQEEEATDELFDAFYRDDPAVGQELMKRAEAHAEEYKTILDLLSGVLGIRFHPQFIMKELNDGAVAFHGEKRVTNFAGSAIQTLESVQLNDTGRTIINQFFPAIGKIPVAEAEKASQVLGWLIRAWREQDIVSKFNALFIPIEMILEGVEGNMPEEQRKQVEKLYSLIAASDEDEKEELKNLLNRLVKNQRPSLIDRFTQFAKQAKMIGYERDIKAFTKFNRIRNGLLHRGDAKVRIHVKIGDEELIALGKVQRKLRSM
jgi:hypothetical protein